MNLATLALRNLFRRAMRTFVITASVALATASALSLLSVAGSIERSIGAGLDERNADLTIQQRKAPDVFSGFISEDALVRLSQVPGITEVMGELVMFAPVERDQQRLVTGWPPDNFMLRHMPVAAGSAGRLDQPRIAIIGGAVAESLNKGVGDTIDILDAPFKIVGVSAYQSAILRSVIIVPLHDLQELAFRQGQVTFALARLAPGLNANQIATLRADIETGGTLLVAPTDQLLRNDRNLKILRAISRTVSWIALTMGGLAVLNTLLMAVQERIAEIGIMMAIGWTRARIMASIVVEGAVIGFAGSLCGTALAHGLSILFTSAPIIGEIVEFRPTSDMILPTLASSVVICTLGALYPAWRAASMEPADALRRV